MSEVISIHIGTAGCRLGEAFWDRVSREHGVHPDNPTGNAAPASFFTSSPARPFCRALFVDLEPRVVDALGTGPLRMLLWPAMLLSAEHDTGGNCARATNAVGREVMQKAADRIRRLADDCRNLQGFLVTHAIGGGTGAGLGALLLQHLAEQYPDKVIVTFTLLPADDRVDQSPVTAPYNALLAARALAEHAHLAFLLENRCVHGLAARSPNAKSPTWAELNAPIADAMARVTAPLRKGSLPALDLRGYQSALAPSATSKLRSVAEAVRLAEGETGGTEALNANIGGWLSSLVETFDRLSAKKAYLHHFAREGLNEAALREARAKVSALGQAYQA
jgi:tubulin alpha